MTLERLQLEGKIKILENELETRLMAAESTVSGQCDRVTTIVRDLERKQESFLRDLEVLGERLDGVGAPPGPGLSRPPSQRTSRAPSPRSDRGGAQVSDVRVSYSPGLHPPPLSGEPKRRPSRDQLLQKGWTKAPAPSTT
mmetsp:Transcript_135218/g.342130  ORF Transcript_135218/g.342130 Transcript_135218/m.342130 type:complete len:140 (-) Transcript_135218:90-509(-)